MLYTSLYTFLDKSNKYHIQSSKESVKHMGHFLD